LGVKRDRGDPISMVHQSEHPLLGFDVTQVHMEVLTSTNECSTIRSKFKASYSSPMVIKHLTFELLSITFVDPDSSIDVS
jgi:hypothetical protein